MKKKFVEVTVENTTMETFLGLWLSGFRSRAGAGLAGSRVEGIKGHMRGLGLRLTGLWFRVIGV